jgi:1,4-dihydroxy-2-naphthoate octaprenyltransferase
MRSLLLSVLCLAAGVCAASNYRDVQRAVDDDQMLQSAGVTPADAKLRQQCSAAVIETTIRPSSSIASTCRPRRT